MNAWAINGSYYDNNAGHVVLSTSRKIGIAKNDQVIIYKRDLDDIVFAGYSQVSEVELLQKAANQFQFTLIMKSMKEIGHRLSVYDMAYSLKKIYRYTNPLLHFRRKYVWLSKADFDTILKGRIYWSRTAFGLFANSMTKSHYVQFITETYPSVLNINEKAGLGYAEGWGKIKDFILNHFVEASYLMKDIRLKAEELEKDGDIGLKYNDLKFSSNDSEVKDEINKQEQLLTEFARSLNLTTSNVQLFKAIDMQINENLAAEGEFEAIFEGESWLLHPPVNNY